MKKVLPVLGELFLTVFVDSETHLVGVYRPLMPEKHSLLRQENGMNAKILFSSTTSYRDSLPSYENYAVVNRAILEKLMQRKKQAWQMIQVDDVIENIETVIEELMRAEKLHFESLGHLYEVRPIGKVGRSQNDAEFQLRSFETIENQLLYFPDFDVAFTQIYFFVSNGQTWPENQFFAPSEQHIIRFIEHLNTQQREVMKKTITYLVDTESGVEKKTFDVDQSIQREDVLLDVQIKNDIFRTIDEFFMNDGAFYKQYNLPYKRGILLYGAPGNGKTTLVRSITGTTDAPVIYWQITEHTGSYTIQEVFNTVARLAPAILVIEDIDSMPSHTRSTFLNILDGARVRAGLFIIGTTNYPERIDPALINRAGRFDSTYELTTPVTDIRKKYLQQLDQQQLLIEEQLIEITTLTAGLSMSQLNELYMSIALGFHYDKKIEYKRRIKDLQKQHKRANDGNWDQEHSIGF